MSHTQDFWNAAAPLIRVTEKHPFLVAMVDGTLDMESFRYYVIQDALYLGDFADCLRRLSKQASNAQDAERLEAFAKGAEEAEMELHNGFFKEWDISAGGVEQMPNSLLYTSYMKRIVATKCHAEGLAVLLPCFWVYMHVGQEMLKLRKELGDRYVIDSISCFVLGGVIVLYARASSFVLSGLRARCCLPTHTPLLTNDMQRLSSKTV